MRLGQTISTLLLLLPSTGLDTGIGNEGIGMDREDQREERTGLSVQEMAEENARDRENEMAPPSDRWAVSTPNQGEEKFGHTDREPDQFGGGEKDGDQAAEDGSLREEMAAEVTPPVTQGVGVPTKYPLKGEEVAYREQMESIEKGKEEAEEGGRLLGWSALILSLLSLFFLPVLTASAGIVTGFFAYRGGSRTLGLWAIGIGLFSLIIALIFPPFLARF